MWTKRPTYEEVLGEIEKDYVRKLPNRMALQFYDSFAMTQFREQQQESILTRPMRTNSETRPCDRPLQKVAAAAAWPSTS